MIEAEIRARALIFAKLSKNENNAANGVFFICHIHRELQALPPSPVRGRRGLQSMVFAQDHGLNDSACAGI
jgi:hypothetical protein